MADTKKPADAAKTAPAPKVTPEAEAMSRINLLQEGTKALEGEIRTLSGRLKNRDPALIAPIKSENQALRERLENLEKILFSFLLETQIPRQSDDAKNQLEILKTAAVEYFKKANVNPDLWKNIVF